MLNKIQSNLIKPNFYPIKPQNNSSFLHHLNLIPVPSWTIQ